MRFIFYSHDGFGLGHTSRNLAIARALTELAPRAAVLMATGSDDITRLGVPDRVEILKLPGLRKVANEDYTARYLGVSGSDVRHLRAKLLASAVESFQPDVLLVDKHPFGAGGELKDALKALHRSGGRAVLGLRDILDEPETVRAEWAPHQLPDTIPAHYDSVLVYGQREIFDLAQAYAFPAELRARTHYCGYVIPPRPVEPTLSTPTPETNDRPLVLSTVGGGEDGYELLETFLAALADTPWHGVAVTGPLMAGAQHSTLEVLAHSHGVELHTFVPQLDRWFARAGAVVCMGGYNTVAQTLAAGAPVICVPRTEPRREQLVRAEAFAQRGLLRLVRPEELSIVRLRQEITAALAESRDALRAHIRGVAEFEGAEFAAHHLLAVARRTRRPQSRITPSTP